MAFTLGLPGSSGTDYVIAVFVHLYTDSQVTAHIQRVRGAGSERKP